MTRIHFPRVKMDGQQFRLLSILDEAALTADFIERDISVVIVDPVMSTVGGKVDPNRHHGKRAMTALIDSIRRGVPTGLEEIAQVERTLWRRRDDILAFFDHHASNGPTEAINGRLEALRRNALGFRNLTHYRLRSLLHCGNLAHRINAL